LRELLVEVLLRLPKVIVAAVVGLIAWLIATGVAGATGSVELWLLCWLGGAALVLLIQEGPI
jgi:type III secretory pathway component EscS